MNDGKFKAKLLLNRRVNLLNPTNSNGTHSIHYRPDIDGLRALAVLLVIGFHFFPKWVAGGYVGVDIFFVISGFLITSILIREKISHGISLLDFYARRVRRILPALLVVIVASWWIGRFTMLSAEFLRLGRHIMAGSFFYSNIQLWTESGYFDTDSTLKPLLHLWSLSVEEQFYLIWPLIIILLPMKIIPRAILVLGIVSFTLNVILIDRNSAFVFYFMPTRFWELLIGCSLAMAGRPFKVLNGRQNILATLSLIALLTSALCFNDHSPFPGWRALVPCLSTAALILCSKSYWNRYFLNQPILTTIGKISYPLYLWHWPLLSFLNLVQDGQLSDKLKFMTLSLTFILAFLTWRFIESPIRSFISVSRLKNRTVVTFGGCALLVIYLLGLSNVLHAGLPERFPEKEPRDEYQTGSVKCASRYGISRDGYCYSTSDNPKVAFLGDSYARSAFFGELASQSEISKSMIVLGAPSCPPLNGVYSEVNSTCEEINKIIPSLFRSELAGVETVILLLRGPRYLSDDEEYDFPKAPSNWKLKSALSHEQSLGQRELLKRGLARSIDFFHSIRKQVILFMPWPELNFQPNSCFDTRPTRLIKIKTREPCAVPLNKVSERQSDYRELVSSLMVRNGYLQVFDPLPLICDTSQCLAGKKSAWYSDSNHLNAKGFSHLTDSLSSMIRASK